MLFSNLARAIESDPELKREIVQWIKNNELHNFSSGGTLFEYRQCLCCGNESRSDSGEDVEHEADCLFARLV